MGCYEIIGTGAGMAIAWLLVMTTPISSPWSGRFALLAIFATLLFVKACKPGNGALAPKGNRRKNDKR
jgi:hypothetical protein